MCKGRGTDHHLLQPSVFNSVNTVRTFDTSKPGQAPGIGSMQCKAYNFLALYELCRASPYAAWLIPPTTRELTC